MRFIVLCDIFFLTMKLRACESFFDPIYSYGREVLNNNMAKIIFKKGALNIIL